VKLMAEVPVVKRSSTIQGPLRIPTAKVRAVELFGIAASTGGPPALATILGGLPADLPFSVLIAQHMREGFCDGMLRYLQRSTQLKVEMVRSPTKPAIGTVYVPPDGHDLLVDPALWLRSSKSSGGVAPSGDRLLESMARAVGRQAVGAVLTGMGEDGAAGLLAIRKAGGVTMAQDELSSVVFGMPMAAIENGAAQEVLTLNAIAPFVCSLFRRKV
jgi:two-component system chemotaxis response regulator CheB